MHLIINSPAIPEEAHWDQEAEEHAQREAHFGLVFAVVALGELDYCCVAGFGNEAYA